MIKKTIKTNKKKHYVCSKLNEFQHAKNEWIIYFLLSLISFRYSLSPEQEIIELSMKYVKLMF